MRWDGPQLDPLLRFQLPPADLDEGRHARRIDSETLSDEAIVGPQIV